MSVTVAVSPEIAVSGPLQVVDHERLLRQAYRRRVEALSKPSRPLVRCGEGHALLEAVRLAFFEHYPLVLSPDAIWLTLARGFALHVNQNAEQLRNHFVRHQGKETLEVERRDFLPGRDNPWPEAFEAFSDQVAERVGKVRDFVRCGFSTTGPTERAAANLLVMDTFQAYFEYKARLGCGIPRITLTGTPEDWQSIRNRASLFAEYGLDHWVRALDPILAQFVSASQGRADQAFWQSFFRYRGLSGPAVLTGWITVLFPYLKRERGELYPSPYLSGWQRRLETFDGQKWHEHCGDPQGVGIGAVPPALASAPVKVIWGEGAPETAMRFVGGLIGVSQGRDLSVEPECGWAVLYEDPVDPLSPGRAIREERGPMREP